MDQNKMMEYQMIEQQMQGLSQNLENIEKSIVDLESLQESLDDFKKLKKGDKTLVSLANGIFAEAKLEETDKLVVNVGTNITVKKTIEETKQMLDTQKKELETFKEEAISNYEQLYARMTLLQQEMMSNQQKAE